MGVEADWLLKDADVNVALGAEVRSAREAAGLTRPELVAQLPFKTTVPTLLNWELGHRAISYARLVELSRTLNCTGHELLRRAIERVDSIQSLLVELDLRPLLENRDPRFGMLRTWAENKLAAKNDEGTTVAVHHSVVREWAILLGMRLNDLVNHLEATAALQQVSER
jgi:transcriptional regulator with XRE-family HTH domain